MNESVWQAILDRERDGRNARKDNEEASSDLDPAELNEVEEEMEAELADPEFISDVSEDEDGMSDLEDVTVSFIFITTTPSP